MELGERDDRPLDTSFRAGSSIFGSSSKAASAHQPAKAGSARPIVAPIEMP